MLIVKFEIWPEGESDRAFEISRVGISNVSGLMARADYQVTALLGRDMDEKVLRTEVVDHLRSAGYLPLTRRVLTNLCLADELAFELPYDDPTAELLRRGDRVGDRPNRRR